MATLLLCRPDRVGDVIISTSCLEPVRRWQQPGDRLVFLAREPMRSLLEGHPLLDGFVGLPGPSSTHPSDARRPQTALTKALTRWQPDAVVFLHPDPPAQWAARAAGVPRRVGYRSHWWLDWRTLTDRLPDARRLGRWHEAEHNFDPLARLGIARPPLDQLRPSVHLPESWRESLRIRLAAAGFERFDESDEPYAVLNPTAYSPDHRWRPANFAWLATELLKPGRMTRVFLIGESVHDPSLREIRRLLGDGVPGLIDLSGQTSLAELGWLLRYARVLVTRDTGPSHLAAAVGCPVALMFGRLEPTYGPGRWRALGPRVEIIPSPAVRGRWEPKRAFWRRAYAEVPRDAVLAAALKLADTRPDAGDRSDKET